ncbi:MAG: 50S ribosomal protein L10 [Planctomycetes bacterium]|nr:50S ribosomal protein L10 [Planctomycetota bacterium]
MSKLLRRRMVDELVRKHQGDRHLLLVNCQGLTGHQSVELRRDLREAQLRMTVLKNSVAHHAFEKLGLKELQKHLTGMNALAVGPDPVVLAKKLVAFREKTQKSEVKGGLVDGRWVGPEEVLELSRLPGREQLLATLLGTMNAPAQQLAGTIHEVIRKFLGAMAAIEEKLKTESKSS